jgi:hypothetical protein
MDKIYGLVKGQCLNSLCTVIKQDPDFEEKNEAVVILILFKMGGEVVIKTNHQQAQ